MWKLQKPVVLQKTSLNMNMNEDNCQPEIKKSNSKTAATTPASESVRAPVSACMMEQAAVANWVTERIADQKIHSLTHWELFTIVSGLKRTFMWKTEAADDSVTVQFFDINIDTTGKLPACLYTASCFRIAVKINKHLI